MNGMDTNGAAMRQDVLQIPAGDHVVELQAAGLPEDASAVVQMLKTEAVKLSVWIDTARVYLASGREQQYEHILRCAQLLCLQCCALCHVRMIL